MFKLSKLFFSLVLCMSLTCGMVVPTDEYVDASCHVCKASKEKGKLIRVEPYKSKPITKGDKRTRICVLMGIYKKGNRTYRRCYKYAPIGKVAPAPKPVQLPGPRKVVSAKYILKPFQQHPTFSFTAMNTKPKKNVGSLGYSIYIPWNGSAQLVKGTDKPKPVIVYLQRLNHKQWKTVAHSGINMKSIPKSTPFFFKEYGGNLLMGASYRFLIKSNESSNMVNVNIGVGNAHPVDVSNLKF